MAGFFKNKLEGRDRKSLEWLKNANLKEETEGRLKAAHAQALRTRCIMKYIENEDITSFCRMRGKRDKTTAHNCRNVVSRPSVRMEKLAFFFLPSINISSFSVCYYMD